MIATVSDTMMVSVCNLGLNQTMFQVPKRTMQYTARDIGMVGQIATIMMYTMMRTMMNVEASTLTMILKTIFRRNKQNGAKPDNTKLR